MATIKKRASKRPRRGKPLSMPPKWQALAERAGGADKLAQELSVTYVTVNRWARGTRNMAGPSRQLVQRLAAEWGLEDPTGESGGSTGESGSGPVDE